LYTYRGGIKTLVWTDALQSAFLLGALLLSILFLARQLNFNVIEMISAVQHSPHSKIFFWNWKEPSFFVKQLLSGAFIAIVMTGLDQNMMQKNLSCRSLSEAQKNIYAFSSVLLVINLLFVSLGALLYLYAEKSGLPLPQRSDDLFPLIALTELGGAAAIVFLLGITAATFSSADSVLTTLTTSFCIDFLKFNTSLPEQEKQKRIRHAVHVLFAILLLLVILLFRAIQNESVIQSVLRVAGYTYGPLLGLFAFGILTGRSVRDAWVPLICLLAPVLSYVINLYSVELLAGYKFGFEILLVNGLLTFTGLYLISERNSMGK
jgi:Na+/proline symporter